MAAARGDPWLREFAEARILADDAFVLLQERREQQQQQADAGVARLSAASRRKLTALSTKVSALEAALSAGDVSAKEVDRRRDMVARLRVHVVQLTELLSKKHDAAGRRGDAGGVGGADERPRETLETAERDELGLLVLQRELIEQQDEQLDELSRVVTSTRHIALAVHEELDLQSRLLDDVEDDVEHTTGRLVVATKKLKLLIKKSNECKLMVCLLLVVAVLIAVLVLVAKVAPLGG